LTRLRELLFPLIAVLCAFAVGGVVVLLVGDSPIEVYLDRAAATGLDL